MRPYRIVLAAMPGILQGIVDSVVSSLPGTEIVRVGRGLDELAEVCRKLQADLAIIGAQGDGFPQEGNSVLRRNPLIWLMVLMDDGRQLALHRSLGEASPAKLRREIRSLMTQTRSA
jgi:hypothetical protein